MKRENLCPADIDVVLIAEVFGRCVYQENAKFIFYPL